MNNGQRQSNNGEIMQNIELPSFDHFKRITDNFEAQIRNIELEQRQITMKIQFLNQNGNRSGRLIMKRRWRICSQLRILLFGICVVTCLAVELLSFWVASIYWKLPNKPFANTTVLLLVADPQLIGHRNEPSWFGWLSRWDSDRYLHRGYSHAVEMVKPHLEIFLGDLLDEGLLMDDEHFALEHKRFMRVFPLHPHKSRIYLPGDNDIGGEYEPVYPHLYERFQRTFLPHLNFDSAEFKQLTIYKNNPLRYGEFEGIHGNEQIPSTGDYADSVMPIRLLLSHFPIIPHMTSRMGQELRRIHVVLSAHDHTTALYMQWRGTSPVHRSASALDVPHALWTLSLNDPAEFPLIEFKVPTCSYRMGVPAMGYAVLMLTRFHGNNTALAQFTILWLPGRFPQLIFYAILAFLLPIGYIVFALVCAKFNANGSLYRRCCGGQIRRRGETTVIVKGRKYAVEKRDEDWRSSRSNKYSRIDSDEV